MQYCFQFSQHQAALQQQQNAASLAAAAAAQQSQPILLQGAQGGQFTLSQAPQLLQVQLPNVNNNVNTCEPNANNANSGHPVDVQNAAAAAAAAAAAVQQQHQSILLSGQGGQPIQIVQPVITSNGEPLVQPIPIQLTPQQIQLIRMQLQAQGSPANQPIIVQTAPMPGAVAGGQFVQAGGQFLAQTVIGTPTNDVNVNQPTIVNDVDDDSRE